MGMYDKINASQAGAQRKLFDYSVHTNGRTVEMTRVAVDTDVWGNEERAALSQNEITAVVRFPPGELPILRFRTSGTETADASSLFFYDVLPIEAYFQFKDRVEKDDIFYFTVDDEAGNKLPIILKVADQAGAVTTSLIWKKYLCAPVTGLHELKEDVAGRVLEKIKT